MILYLARATKIFQRYIEILRRWRKYWKKSSDSSKKSSFTTNGK